MSSTPTLRTLRARLQARADAGEWSNSAAVEVYGRAQGWVVTRCARHYVGFQLPSGERLRVRLSMPLASGGGTQKQRGPHGRVEPLISPAENFVKGPIRVYILELEDGCWYVGQAHDPERRLARHRKGNAAQWTAAHKPLRISQVLPETFDSEQAAALFEDAVTLDLMRQHGWRNVRGGGYCDPSEAAILRALEGKLDLGVRSA